MSIPKQDRLGVALIWAVVVVAAVVLGSASNDPAGAGQLAGAVGLLSSWGYLALRRHRRVEPAPLTPAESERSRRLARRHWTEIGIVVGLWSFGALILAGAGVESLRAVLFGAMLPAGYVYLRDLRSRR